ncbi:MAG: DNA repair protein RecN [Lachnospiraceae bacterium]|jgi:DNA repair protein RecN (Recombination protein N)|nr:DNA repair protein RecN [Lachnospiraceae bacterium]
MLLELQVKNLALIEQAQVEFGEGLNILTGETGAGKSIIIGSVNMALGGKASKDSIRQGADSAYIELLFSVGGDAQREALKAMEIFPSEDETLIISRKILPTRSVSKINDETVTTAKLRQVTALLMDIHGQHEHQSLMDIHKHLEILDAYGKGKIASWKEKIRREYQEYRKLKEKLSSMETGQEDRLREADFCRFEIENIEEAALKEGEEEELTSRYRKLSHMQRIMEALSSAYEVLEGDSLGRAVRDVDQVAGFDEDLSPIRDQLLDLEALSNELERSIQEYMDGCQFEESEFRQIEERLDVIRGLQAKYGPTIAQVFKVLEEKKKRLEELENYDEIREELKRKLSEAEKVLAGDCEQLSAIRNAAGKILAEKIKESLIDLNFLEVEFVMEFRRLDHYTIEGFDEAEFLISTNPGQPVRPLKAVASGGELSRIMLAIKTVLADTDEIPTLIFDEIDTGISGRTAQKVSEKLKEISRTHQVICITHLPQIASMADSHFEIAKSIKGKETVTNIRRLGREESIDELARLLGGAEITEAVRKNAKEMKELAERAK